MKEQGKIRLHRFNDQVAFESDDTETLYISADLAIKFGEALSRIAWNIRSVNFANSTNQTTTINIENEE